ncbi:MAG: hypothetical protein AB1403_14810 [Candidatus Riflebacteria bacterium]
MKNYGQLAKNLVHLIALFTVVISLAGCPGGGGGGGGTVTPPVNTNPVHTQFTQQKAYVYQAGLAYNVSTTFSETRGDEIQFNKMYTYRTFADTYNSGRTANYYNAGPSMVYGWMFDVQGTISGNIRDAYIENTSNQVAWTPNTLKGYESRTLKTQVMIGKAGQTKPAGFNGFYIPWENYREWSLAGYPGVRYWVTLEGYDYKLNDNYNVHVPIEIMFPGNLSSDGSYPVNTGTGTGTGTDPYNTGI